MTTPAQPAPVTPPPEWAVKAAKDIIVTEMEASYPGGVQDYARIIARHAPPPAPSCPTEQGFWAALVERLEGVKGFIKRVEDATGDEFMWYNYTQSYCALDDAINALSRQPAAAAVAKDREEVARVVERLREELRLAGLAKRHPEVVTKLETLLTDAISLLSQPAVAQTEAGNDMTASRPDVPSLEYIAASPLTRYGGFHPTTVQIAKDAIATIAALRAEVTRLSGKAADGDSAPVMSSPKSVSPSVPAVAGGGEDARRLDWLFEHGLTVYHMQGTGAWSAHYSTRDAIDAAIAANKAKEGRNL